MKKQDKNRNIQIPVIYVATILECLKEKGIEYNTELDNVDRVIEELVSLNGRISLANFEQIIKGLENVVTGAEFWLYCGQKLTLSSHGTFGMGLMNCSTAWEAMEFFYRYYKIQAPAIHIMKTESPDYVQFTLEHNLASGYSAEVDCYLFFSCIQNNISVLLQEEMPAIEYHLDKPQIEALSVYKEYLGEQVFFNSKKAYVKIPKNLLKKEIIFSNPVMRDHLRMQCEQQLKELMIPNDLVANVRGIITATPGLFPSVQQVAEHLNMSARTLRRKLDEEGTSYRELLEAIKLEKAKQYLEDSALTVEEIADLLCYSDTANFRRAFIRWVGQSPAAYRDEFIAQTTAGLSH